jgi:hypothetical protein
MNNVVVHKNGCLTFYLYPKSIVFCTDYQSVRVTCSSHVYKHRLNSLKNDIISGKATTIQDVAKYNNGDELRWSSTCVELAGVN